MLQGKRDKLYLATYPPKEGLMYLIKIESPDHVRETVFACTDEHKFWYYAKKYASDANATFWLNNKQIVPMG
jgi:hypothetical protein